MKIILKICFLLLFFKLTSQNLQWGFGHTGPGVQFGRSIEVKNGVVVCTGFFSNSFDADPGPAVYTLTSNGANDFFLVRYDTDGNFLSGFSIGGSGNESGRNDVCFDPYGNIYAAIVFENTMDADPGAGVVNYTASGITNSVIVKFDFDGNYISSFYLEAEGNGIFADSAYLYLTGCFNGTVDFDPGVSVTSRTTPLRGLFAARFTNTGVFDWVAAIDNTASAATCTGITTDQLGNVIFIGYFGGTNIDFDAGPGSALMTSNSSLFDTFVAKYDSGGNYLWAHHTGGVVDNVLYALQCIGTDIIVGGYVQGTLDLDPGAPSLNVTTNQGDAYLARFNSSGSLVWANVFGGDQYDDVIDLDISSTGDIVVTGGFSSDTMDIDPGSATVKVYPPVDDNNGYDGYVALFDQNGNYKWSMVYGDSSWDQGNAVTIDEYDNWYFAVRFGKRGIDIDPSASDFMISSIDTHDNIIMKLSPCERMNPSVASNLQLNEDANVSIPCVVSTGSPQAYQWYKDDVLAAGETNSSFSFSQLAFADQGTYKVKVTDACMNTKWSGDLALTIIPVVKVYELISPNEDGQNDFFNIRNIDKFPSHDITVFNRWGQKVFTSSNYSNDWDAGNLPDGTYFYKVVVGEDEFKGSLLIKR